MEPLDLLRYFADAVEPLGIPYFVTGSMASTMYGEPRTTADIDIVADLRPDKVAAFCACFPDTEFLCQEGPVRQAVASRFMTNIVHPGSGLKIDLIIPSDSEYDRLRLARRVRLVTAKGEAWFASPEDVILKKLEYYQLGGSDKHLRDIASVLKVRGALVDEEYLNCWAARLGVAECLRLVRERVAASVTPSPDADPLPSSP